MGVRDEVRNVEKEERRELGKTLLRGGRLEASGCISENGDS